MYSLESPRRGDSNEYTQYAFMLMKIEKLFLLCHLTWHYNQPSLARTIRLELVPKVFEPLKFDCITKHRKKKTETDDKIEQYVFVNSNNSPTEDLYLNATNIKSIKMRVTFKLYLVMVNVSDTN